KKIGCFRFEVAVDFIPIGVVIGKGCVNLSEVDVGILFHSFFWREPALITGHDLMDRHTGTVDSDASAADGGRTAQKSVDRSAHNWFHSTLQSPSLASTPREPVNSGREQRRRRRGHDKTLGPAFCTFLP